MDRMNLLEIVVESLVYMHKGECWAWSLLGPYHVIEPLLNENCSSPVDTKTTKISSVWLKSLMC